ncbi:MAG: type II toxin-antitoxin system RelE/ParE family toxin [Acidobacteria bacterium]|nr:type II toxin-antitoxin system RelE/ParE family toxin [Acidobacteriota bacterium]
MRFIETSVFTRQITSILDDEEYAELQAALVFRPELGVVIQSTGGLRKVRWGHSGRGKGKRGGARVIYYWYQADDVIYMLLAYSKGERDDLSAKEKRILRQLVKEEFR